MATEVVLGDKVRVEFDGDVCTVLGDSRADVDVTIGGEVFHVGRVPVNKMVVTKAVAPPQPAIGTIMSYFGDRYIRTAPGWRYVSSSGVATLGTPVAWNFFDHASVYMLTRSDSPMAKR